MDNLKFEEDLTDKVVDALHKISYLSARGGIGLMLWSWIERMERYGMGKEIIMLTQPSLVIFTPVATLCR